MPLPVVWKLVKGRSKDFPYATRNDDGTYGNTFDGTEPITCTVWGGDALTPLLTFTGPPNAWLDPNLSRWVVSFDDEQTATLSAGVYSVEATALSQPGRTALLFRGLLEVMDSPGTNASTDLVTSWDLLRMLGDGWQPTVAQLAAIPDLISASSQAIERWCYRRFAQATLVEDVAVSTYGKVRLSRPPINRVLRVQAQPIHVLWIRNLGAASAWVSMESTGDIATGRDVTGIVLNWQDASGTNSWPIEFETLPDQSIASLAGAVGAVGFGWWGEADPTLGVLPISELSDLAVGKAAGPRGSPQGAASFSVYSRILSDYRPETDGGEWTGMYVVGRRPSGGEAAQWGPGGEELWDGPTGGGPGIPNRVRFTYDGGFATIPAPIQLACSELVRAQSLRLGTDPLLRKERAGEYEYELNPQALRAMPEQVTQALSAYRIAPA